MNFHPIVSEWFHTAFPAATTIQVRAWKEISGGANVLVSAPTGSGKVLST